MKRRDVPLVKLLCRSHWLDLKYIMCPGLLGKSRCVYHETAPKKKAWKNSINFCYASTMSSQSNKYVRILFNIFGAFPSETTPSSHPFWGLSHELWTSLGVPANIPVTSPSSSATRCRHECPQRRSSEPDRGGAANLRQGDLLAWCLVIVTMWCPIVS